MRKTVHICDCCGKEVPEKDLYQCYRELRTWVGYKNIVKVWDLCIDCIKHLESTLESEIQRVDFWSKKRENKNDY